VRYLSGTALSLRARRALECGSTAPLGEAAAGVIAGLAARVALLARHGGKLPEVAPELPAPDWQQHGRVRADVAGAEGAGAGAGGVEHDPGGGGELGQDAGDGAGAAGDHGEQRAAGVHGDSAAGVAVQVAGGEGGEDVRGRREGDGGGDSGGAAGAAGGRRGG